MTGVVVLNATHEPLGVVSLKRAMVYLATERAVVVQARDGEVWRSADTEIPVPVVVRFVRYIRIPYRWRQATWTRRGVLARDQHRCAYCGGRGTTIDHILPRSRGGKDEWMNTVAACQKCNGAKADRTPEEARMSLRFRPREVTERDTLIVAIAQTGADLGALGLAI